MPIERSASDSRSARLAHDAEPGAGGCLAPGRRDGHEATHVETEVAQALDEAGGEAGLRATLDPDRRSS